MPDPEARGLDAYLGEAIAEHYRDDDDLELANDIAGHDDVVAHMDDQLDPNDQKIVDELLKDPHLFDVEEQASEEIAPDERTRGPDGKFLPKDQAEAKPEAASAKARTDQPAQQSETAQAQQVELPANWSAEWKGKVATLPPEAQRAVVDQYKAFQADYTRKAQDLSEARKTYEPLIAKSQQYQPFLQQIGYTPDRFYEESIAVAQRLLVGTPQQQGEAIAYLMKLHSIDPNAVLQSYGVPLQPGETIPQAPDVGRHPVVQQLQSNFSAVTAELQRIKELQTSQAQAEFDAIGQMKDDNGEPLYPHWNAVRTTMIDLAASGKAQTWDEAYKKAVRSDDNLYHADIEAVVNRRLQEQERKRSEAVAKAKKAAPVATSNSAPRGGEQLKGLDAHLSAALDKYYQE